MKGTLIPIGGNEDKGLGLDERHTLDFISEGILSRVVKECHHKNPNIVIIPTASSIPDEVAQNYLDAFSKLGCSNLAVLDVRSREDAIQANAYKLIEKADCIMFSGGDQSRIADFFGNTKVHDLLKHRYQYSNLVIAGTSAGAMCMSREMIAGGNSTEAMFKGAVRMRTGLNLVGELIIDTHFIQRGRFGRLAEAVARFPSQIGVGLAEDTGLVIKNGTECTVIGSGMVVIFDPSKLTHNNVLILEEGTPMSMSNLVVDILANGDKFTIQNRKIQILPIDASFEV